MERVENETYLNILSNLEMHGELFYHMVNCNGRMFWDQMIPTAMVTFAENGQHLDLHINRKFWERISETKKIWVIIHELLHVAYGHGLAPKDYDRSTYNVACDIVVNHNSIRYYGFYRSAIDSENRYCWLDTVFPDTHETIPEGRTSDFYYNLLVKSGYDGQQSGEVMDYHPSMSPQQAEDARNWYNSFNDYVQALPDEVKVTISGQLQDDKSISTPHVGGSGAGGMQIVLPAVKVMKKKKWETVIKRWALKFNKKADHSNEQWTLKNRRNVLLDDSLFLPSEHEEEVDSKQNAKIEVYFFLDTSGSCVGYAQRFWKAAKSLDPKKFNLRLFCFDTRVYETDLKSGKLYGFGGTYFNILENKIQSIVSSENVKYPKAVFVITDGYGSTIRPEKPEVWHWFITSGGSTRLIDSGCKFYKLSDYE